VNTNILSFPERRRKLSAGEQKNSEPRPVTTIQLEMPALLGDRIKIAAGYACKSPGQWARDALTALLDMDLAG
jgi:hypothetical protein